MDSTRELFSVIEECRISPPCKTVGERTLPLTFFDLIWLIESFYAHYILAYEFPHSKAYFTQTLIPTLKNSLSLTLQHFFPFAGNLIVSKGRKPEIRHVEGDSIALTFVECEDLDFNDLIGNHPRDCNKFYGLVPMLEGGTKVSDNSIKIPLFSVQVTFFPNRGITIGVTNHHILCDASTKFDFLKAWAMITKCGSDELFLAKGVFPFYDRVINYPNILDERFLNLPIDVDQYKPSKLARHENNKVRATIVFTQPQISWLKKWVLTKLPTLEYVSSFTVVCGYVWSCIAKSRTHTFGDTINGKGDDDDEELEIFVCAVDWRGRLDPPIPQCYFGNFVWPCFTTAKTSSLLSSSGTNGSGFLNAVELLGNSIRESVKIKGGVIKDAETWDEKFGKGLPTTGVAGTPKFKVYDLDFGWGKPIKYEVLSIDNNGTISVNACKDSPQDIEIGLALPAKQMNAFIAISENELENIFYEQQ